MENDLIEKGGIRSVSGNLWKLLECAERDILALRQKHDVSEIVAQIMAIRGIGLDDAHEFLHPSLKDSLPDPSHLLDMDKAAERVVQAIESKQNIVIFGDYDVDGATSSALLSRFFTSLGAKVSTYIPDRIVEGYGPNADALTKLKNQGADVVITVDCGAVSFEPLAHAKKIGLDVIVVDHHLGADTLPEAAAVVNPNRLDETTDYRNLAAVGVAFLLAVAVNRLLREKGFYKKNKQPDLLSLLDIVALGTVCDVMTLTGLNRVFVSQGLKVMAARNNLGLRVLADVSRMDGYPNVYHLGFVLGPRINAGGRIGKADLGTRLLTTSDVDEAYEIAGELEKLNLERKSIESQVLDEALLIAEQLDVKGDAFLLVAPDEGSYWHAGVIGIVASRIKERFSKPCAVLSVDDGVAKASARSVYGVDVGAAVSQARSEEILIAGGGHAMAAGFSVEVGRIQELRDFFNELLGQNIADYQSTKTLKIDVKLPLSAVSVELIDAFEAMAPFGNGNSEPRFMFENVSIVKTKLVGINHLMLFLKENGASVSSKMIKAMAFRALETPLGDAIMKIGDKPVNVAGKIKRNNWQGVQKAEIFIDDLCFHCPCP